MPGLFTRHEHGSNKARNWSLSPSREVLILGASNISRLPLVHDPRVQVDSFPGANLAQAATIIRKNTVVLSFGLSDRDIWDSTLLVNDLRRLLNAARDTFPNADIRVPIINISAHSSPLQMENIRILNQQNFHTHQSLPKLRRSAFTTERDHVHWSPDTAVAMWEHWASLLGLGIQSSTLHR
ncbi:hypothetical protein JOQ06_009706 [Pogonophryne albipinna]|uniref:Uncharacterized protein n=1 Tax=Pogonophryne albipinna TaxID=1090488 RepID=A0AAD6BQ20_9TELE|nr:hypothetical protein JOQ06_009706 [Pogonophryne albipinna]